MTKLYYDNAIDAIYNAKKRGSMTDKKQDFIDLVKLGREQEND